MLHLRDLWQAAPTNSGDDMTNIHTLRSPKVEVRTSPTEGRGCFATADISKGEVVGAKAGHFVTMAENQRLEAEIGDFALQIGEGLYIAPRTKAEVEQTVMFMNHSCDANIGFQGDVVYMAMKDIKAGEELFNDYGTFRGDYYVLEGCRCGSPLCRGRATGEDWKRPELQKRYGMGFQTYLLRRMGKIEGY